MYTHTCIVNVFIYSIHIYFVYMYCMLKSLCSINVHVYVYCIRTWIVYDFSTLYNPFILNEYMYCIYVNKKTSYYIHWHPQPAYYSWNAQAGELSVARAAGGMERWAIPATNSLVSPNKRTHFLLWIDWYFMACLMFLDLYILFQYLNSFSIYIYIYTYID